MTHFITPRLALVNHYTLAATELAYCSAAAPVHLIIVMLPYRHIASRFRYFFVSPFHDFVTLPLYHPDISHCDISPH